MAKKSTTPPRERILKYALQEFSRGGYAGARVDRIARLAKVNKRMLFYYFGNKDGLFEAVLESAWKQGRILDEAPDHPVDSVRFWHSFYFTKPEWVRLLLWEGLQWENRPVVGEKERKEFWKGGVEKMRRASGPGGWPEFVDTRYFLVSWLGLTIAPLLLPHIAKLTVGLDPHDPRFIREHAKFIETFAQFVADRAKPGSSPPNSETKKSR